MRKGRAADWHGLLLSVLAEDLFAALVALLGFQRQGRDWAGFQAPQTDRLPCLLAVPVAAVLDASERRIDLGDQLALTVAGAKLQRTVRFRGRPVCDVGVLR